MLSGYSGYLQSDGYSAYPCWLNKPEHTAERDAIIHAGCWAHARRKFAEATDSISRKIVRLIAKLYRIETELREKPELDRSAVRQQKPRPSSTTSKQSLTGKKSASCPKAPSAKRSATHWPAGRASPAIWNTASWKSTTTSSKTPFAHRHRQKELPVFRQPRLRPNQRRHLQHNRNLPQTRDQPLRLPARRIKRPANHEQREAPDWTPLDGTPGRPNKPHGLTDPISNPQP